MKKSIEFGRFGVHIEVAEGLTFRGDALEIGQWTVIPRGAILRSPETPNSVTKDQGDVFIVALFPREGLYSARTGKKLVDGGEYGCAVICDRVTVRHGEIHCDGYWRQEKYLKDGWKFHDLSLSYIMVDGATRYLCHQRGARLEDAAGEVCPLCGPDEYLVADYAMSGVWYMSVPVRAFEQIERAAEERGVTFRHCGWDGDIFPREDFVPAGKLH